MWVSTSVKLHRRRLPVPPPLTLTSSSKIGFVVVFTMTERLRSRSSSLVFIPRSDPATFRPFVLVRRWKLRSILNIDGVSRLRTPSRRAA